VKNISRKHKRYAGKKNKRPPFSIWRAFVESLMVPVRQLAKNPLLLLALRLHPIQVIMTKGYFF
jgi:hypothetical protein